MSSEHERAATYIREVTVRYRGARWRTEVPLRHPHDAVAFARKILVDDAREHFLAIYLESRHRPIAYQVVSIGTANQSLVHPREVFQPGVAVGAVAVLIAHNHPSGNANPSAEDREVTQRLAQAGEILGIRVLDHIVFTAEGAYYSFAENAPELLR
jgi:DNA repair protein RadC